MAYVISFFSSSMQMAQNSRSENFTHKITRNIFQVVYKSCLLRLSIHFFKQLSKRTITGFQRPVFHEMILNLRNHKIFFNQFSMNKSGAIFNVEINRYCRKSRNLTFQLLFMTIRIVEFDCARQVSNQLLEYDHYFMAHCRYLD